MGAEFRSDDTSEELEAEGNRDRDSRRQGRRENAEWVSKMEQELGETHIIVALLGEGGKGLAERRRIAKKLEAEGMTAIVPEDDLGVRGMPPIDVEEMYFQESDVDVIFIDVKPLGSEAEFMRFTGNERLCLRIRVLVERQYHPVYDRTNRLALMDGSARKKTGALTWEYMSHEGKYGHTYAYDNAGAGGFPTSGELIEVLAKCHRWLKFEAKHPSKEAKASFK
jgi:hypothetical protein